MPPSDRKIMKLSYDNRAMVIKYAKPFEKQGILDENVSTRIGLENYITIFDHASLRGCHFIETDVTCTSMCFAIMENVEFNKAKVSSSAFESSDMQHAVLINSNISDCNMNNMSLNGSSLTDVKFRGCSMVNCNMSGCSFSSVILDDVNLANTSLTRCRIVGCDFRNVTGLDPYLLEAVEVLYNVTLTNCYDINGNKVKDGIYMDKTDLIDALRNRASSE